MLQKYLSSSLSSFRLKRRHVLSIRRSLSSSACSNLDIFDYLVIGGGSGGIASARRAATYGNTKVALIEKQRLGGTCVNVGCVPKKLMFLASNMGEMLHRDAFYFGYEQKTGGNLSDLIHFDWSKLKQRRDTYIERLNGIYARNLANSNVTLLEGTAAFNAKGQVEVNGKPIQAKKILIAVGGKPWIPDIPGKELCIDSDGFFELETLPKKVAIVGAGYIAVELACVLNGLGADVTIFCRKETVLRNFDESIHTTLRDQMEKNGIFFQPNSNLQRVIKSQKNTKTIVLENGMEHHGFDCVLYAAGRVPMTDDLNLKQAGIEMDSHGYIKVDEYQKTNVENIFAVGDVCADGIALTPVAIAAGRRLSDRLFGNQPQAKISYENIPTVVFSHPTIGTIGLTEEQARQKYSEKEIKIYTSRFVNMYFGLHNEMPMEKSCQQHQQKSSKPSTIIKLICVGKKEKIVGLHIIGMAADEMLQGFGVAIKMGATKADFDSCIAIHPTAAEEVVTMAPWGLCGTH